MEDAMSIKPGSTPSNLDPEGLSQDAADPNLEQDSASQAQAQAKAVPSATGTGSIKVTG